MKSLRPKYKKIEEIRELADKFRKKYVKSDKECQIPIEEIVEFDLGLELWPLKGIESKTNIDGFLSNDLKTIFVDFDRYYDKRYLKRIRFTIAHEVGHYLMHKDEIASCTFKTPEDWIHYRRSMSEDDLFLFEQQAYEFAGRLLVPLELLLEEVSKQEERIKSYKSLHQNGIDYLLEGLARLLSDTFCVSEGVLIRRLRKESKVLELIEQMK